MAESPQPAAPEPDSRLRLVFAVAAAAALGAVVMAVVIAGSGSGDSAEVASAPTQCIRAWNRDPSTVAFGVHNATAHGYSQVQVTRLADDGSALTGTDAGKCAVVFAATSLDPELGAAAQIVINGGWAPLTATGVDTARLAQLQSDAVEQANADLQPDGTIVAR